MKKTKKVIGLAMVVMLTLSVYFNIPVQAADVEAPNENETLREVHFSGLESNPNQEYHGINSMGEEYTVSIEAVPTKERATTRTWKISFTSGVVNCHFYMKVSGNTCTKVYDYKITCIGCTYSNANLSRGTSYGKLRFDVSTYLNIVNFVGWLKGTCTGSNNDVQVSWNF